MSVTVYTRIEDIPPDPKPPAGADHDDSRNYHALLASGVKTRELRTAIWTPAKAALLPPHPYAPLLREMQRNQRGPDVFALQRMLHDVLHVRPDRPTGNFGLKLEQEVKGVQVMYGLDADGIYGAMTHAKVAQYYDAFGAYLLGQAPHPSPREMMLRGFTAAAMLLYAHRMESVYTQGPERMQGVLARLFPPLYPTRSDCSSAFAWCTFAGGMPSYLWTGDPYTGTFYRQGWVVDRSDRGVASLYGPPTGKHMAMGVGAGRIVSHGHDPVSLYADSFYRTDFAQFRAFV